jgi:membrane protein DedA with SNARE-associated domain
MDLTERWLKKWEDAVVFGSRLMPGVRTVVSLPCGFIRVPLVRFTVLTFVGSLIWSAFLGEIGVVMGENWDTLGPYFHAADAVIVAVFLGLGIWYVWHKIKPTHRAAA